jgi:hypothetical protein
MEGGVALDLPRALVRYLGLELAIVMPFL